MRKSLIIATLWLMALGSLHAGPDAPVEMIVRASSGKISAIAQRHGLVVVRSISDGRGLFLLRTNSGSWDAVHAEMDADPDVANCEQNAIVNLPEARTGRLNQSTAAILEALPDRTLVSYFDRLVWRGYVLQPAATIIKIAEAQKQYSSGGGIVAIIDTGIDDRHPALAGGIVPGYDFIRDQNGIPSDTQDLAQSTAAILEGGDTGGVFRAARVNQSTAAILEQSTAAILEARGLPPAFGHGTMVAGLVRLVAPSASIMPLRAFTSDGSASTADILSAIYWAVDHGANVINMSFSMVAPSDELLRALNYANDSNVIAVASAGNAGLETTAYPAAYRHVIGVGSTNNLDVRSTFSNYGSGLVRLAAPGEALITPFPGGAYAAVWGTSFSAALVSGGASLVVDTFSGIDPARADQQLIRTRKVSPELGLGRLDLLEALRRMTIVKR